MKNQVLGLYILHPNNIGRCGHIANASYAGPMTLFSQASCVILCKKSSFLYNGLSCKEGQYELCS